MPYFWISLFVLLSSAISIHAHAADPIGADLQKTMIWADSANKPGTHFIVFRKSITLSARPTHAMLSIFADTRYLLWINGEYVLRGPCRFVPTGPEYDRLDVALHLRAGKNMVAVLVLADASNGKMMRHAPGLTLRLDENKQCLLVTDTSWKWSDSTRYQTPTVNWGNLMDNVDARVEDGDWTQPDYDDSRWPGVTRIDGGQWGALTARRSALLRETVCPQRAAQTLPLTLTAGQSYAFDMGRLVQAYTVLDLDAEAGTVLELKYAGIHYIARAGHQTYLSSDTHGFASGSILVTSGRVTLHNVTFVERLYPFDCVGRFACSDPALNALWKMCTRSCQVMSEDAYDDCADRERTEWMDCDPPGFDVTRVAMAGRSSSGSPVYADAGLLREMLRRTALTLQPDGWVKAHTCSDRYDIHAKMEDRACDWVEGARRYYDSTGDRGLIREIWPAIVTQMQWFLSHRTPRGLVQAREWEVWGNPLGYIQCEGAGLNAFVQKAFVDAAYLGDALGETGQSARFRQASLELAAAFDTLWNEREGTYDSGLIPNTLGRTAKLGELVDYAKPLGAFVSVASGLSSANAKKPGGSDLDVDTDGRIAPTLFPALFALDQGIVPAARRPSVVRYLLAHRDQSKRIMTFYYLWRQLYEVDDPALDTEVLNDMRTLWKPMTESPWQTSWEDFTGGSKAHIYGMFPAYYLSAYVLGVRLDGPARAKRLLIDPRLGDLASAQGVVVTELGLVPVSWIRQGDRLTFNLQLPVGCHGTLRLPSDSLVLDGKPIATKKKDRVMEIQLAGGRHRGIVRLRH